MSNAVAPVVLPELGGPGETRVTEWSGALIAGAIATALAIVAIAMGFRGSDLPAQLFRVELFHQYGFVFWDSQWFGGTPTLDYTVLSPILGALHGPLALCAASGAASAFFFHRLVHRAFGTSALLGSVWFATSTVTNLVVGRVTFALGIAFALGAVLSVQRRKPPLAVAAALCCGLASPVAALFLAVVAVAWGFARPPERAVAWITAFVGVAPVVLIAIWFPSPGTQPYELWAFACDLAVCALFWLIVPERYSALRWGAGAYAAVLVAAYLIPSALGGNVSRLNQYAAGPLLMCALWEHRRRLAFALALPLLFWQWFPAVDTIAFARSDPSTHAAYYQPLLHYLDSRPTTFGRVEIPDTYRHWEASFVAPEFSLARGWERQLDYAYDGQFYDGTLTASSYRTWLVQNGVQYIALPDARLDSSSFTEAKLLATRLPYLEPLWHDAHWTVWRFTGYRGLVDGPARLESLTADAFTLRVTGPGPVTVHVHDSPHWAVYDNGCTTESPDGWIQLHDLKPGETRVVQALRGSRCDVDT